MAWTFASLLRTGHLCHGKSFGKIEGGWKVLDFLERVIEHISTPFAMIFVSLDYLIVGFTIFFVLELLYEEKHKEKEAREWAKK